jgi:NTE family protein
MIDQKAPPRPASYDKKVGLVLHGGGALGSYQAGVYEALSTSEYLPDWVAGISIGAINAAIIAGNVPERRVERLRAFWEGITAPSAFWPAWCCGTPGNDRRASSLNAFMFGQPGFFSPRPPIHWLIGKPPTSYYDTRTLKDTLERLVDFNLINAREMRFSVAAVNVRTGNLTYFDNAKMIVRPEHVMASGALPPGFPAVEVDGECYWDGGLVSNTPLQYLLEGIPRRSRLTFQVDVFPARGRLPTDLEEVNEREKDIRYSSRTRAMTDLFRLMHDLRHNINDLWDKLPEELRQTREAKYLYEFGCVTTMDIVELIYRPTETQGHLKDYEFSRATMRARWEQGLSDARTNLLASPWLASMPAGVGARTFDVLKDPPDAAQPCTGKASKAHEGGARYLEDAHPSTLTRCNVGDVTPQPLTSQRERSGEEKDPIRK